MIRKITRQVKSDLRGKFAIVTGGRIKIGLRIALRLLRDGCFVIVTTRLGFLSFEDEKQLQNHLDHLVYILYKHQKSISKLGQPAGLQ